MDLSEYHTFRVAGCDLNGQMRGKRVPGSYASKLDKGAVRMPLSALNVDIAGADIENSPLVFKTGDADGILKPTDRGPVPLPWLNSEQALVPMGMYWEDGRRFEGDPRHVLVDVLNRYKAKGWSVVAATELEFTLVDDRGDTLTPARNPYTDRMLETPEVLSLTQMDYFDDFLSGLYDSCKAMGIPAQTTTSEAGIGQFEVTLNHQDALRAADDTWLFKTLIRGLARKHGFAATFMAKPFADDSGNGMHMHFSVLDENGTNIFDNGGEDGSETLHQAIAGCIKAMQASTLIFAPHANSYERLVPGAHAPTSICWGYENRTVAVRVPGGPSIARRIEHRVAGGDINPYLNFAVVLGAAIHGVEHKLHPPSPVSGNAYEQELPQLATDWTSAIDLFEIDPVIADIFPADLIRNLVISKRQDQRLMAETSPKDHWRTYLDVV
ncbi:glutamine synthetase family protein [Roseovarius sp. EL26]|uniref:glutamine synthetase family protein n=1 Tax=Roseovarius sp. EL26 TaxID=2126672 RepID=UPI000EA28CA6|nr:glutamine synthetase family protein [Roseovarius sp. EL26]